ncbi:S9 family peptidase [candidate division KSB1 bacterium]|nr:S9 family peptidase [candidate division KSB1 bacterium]RQW06029.1 MAG: S9 family peptidase [candidate division KSB1 bacterium]
MSVLLFYCAGEPKAPIATKIPHKIYTHGHERIDNYFWLRERENQQVLDYLAAENVYREKVMAPFQKFEEKLFDEIRGRIKEDDSTAPAKRGHYWYYQRYEKGQEYPLYCRKKGSLDGEEEVLLDVNELAQNQAYCRVSGLKTSPNHAILSYAVDFVGRRFYNIRLKDLTTGEYLADEIHDVTDNFVWANDNKTLFYARQHPETLRSEKIYRYKLGQQQDELVYFEEDETFDTSVGKTLSEQYVTIFNESTLQTEFLILDADSPDDQFTLYLAREPEHEYYISHGGDCWYILTNKNAKNFKIVQTPEAHREYEFWHDVVPHNDAVLLRDLTVFRNYLVIEEMSTALPHIRIIDRQTGDSFYIDCNEPVYVTYVETNLEYDTDVLRYSFESLKTPESIFDYNMRLREQQLVKQQMVLGGFDSNNYATERLWVGAGDGVEIPMSLLYRKDLQKNSANPALIQGYGSYGISRLPYFNSKYFSLVDRGFIIAIAHVRGGSEMGRSWYENGRQVLKKNTFTDFIDCTTYLIEHDYTSPAHIYAQGGSAGGLLVGAVANMAPQLYNGIIAAVPFVDILTTMLDDSIPLTTAEYDEWGNPNEKIFYDYILSYSPYDNVIAMDYPNMLVTAGLHDSQVQYWEPAKWTAKLRELKTDDNLLILYTNMEAGHGGASGRFEALREDAMEYTFILALEGMTD